MVLIRTQVERRQKSALSTHNNADPVISADEFQGSKGISTCSGYSGEFSNGWGRDKVGETDR